VTRGAVQQFCGAKKRSGGTCRRQPGWGTNHLGIGACKQHGGSTPNHELSAARAQAQGFMAAHLDLPEVDPLQAMLYTVRRTSQIAMYCRLRVGAVEQDEQVRDGQVHIWARLEVEALRELNRFSKAAVDAGVAERLVRVAERDGERLAMAFSDALAVMGDAVTPELRAKAVRVYSDRITRLEDERDDVVSA
jgi:hypothetical protein